MSVDEATYVALNGWVFRNEENPSETWTFPDSSIYLSTQAGDDSIETSDQPQLLYTATTQQAFNTTDTNLALASFDNKRGELLALPLTLPAGVEGSGVISLLGLGTTRAANFGKISLDKSSGRFYFSVSSGDAYYWDPTSGLTTSLFDGGNPNFGGFSVAVDHTRSKVYSGSRWGNSDFFQWDAANLTTQNITNNERDAYGLSNVAIDEKRGLVYFGVNGGSITASATNNYLYMYNEENDTLYTLPEMDSYCVRNLVVNPETGNVFAGSHAGTVYKFTPTQSGSYYDGATLSTIDNVARGGVPEEIGEGSLYLLDRSKDQIIFKGYAWPIYVWEDGFSAVSTLFPSSTSSGKLWGTSRQAIHQQDPSWTNYGLYDRVNNLFYTHRSNSLIKYDLTAHTLSTVTTAAGGGHGYDIDETTGKVYFKEPDSIYSYDPSTGSITTVVDLSNLGAGGFDTVKVSPDGRLLFVGGQGNNVSAFMYNLVSSVSTLLGNFNNPGHASAAFDVHGNVFFGTGTDSDVYRWSEARGLETIIEESQGNYAYGWNYVIDNARKRALFGAGSSATNDSVQVYLYDYSDDETGSSGGTASLYKGSASGVGGATQDLQLKNALSSEPITYTTSTQDEQGSLYLVNSVDNSIHRYALNPSGAFERLNKLTSTAAVIGTNTTIATDPNNSTLSVLNGTTRTVSILSDRTVDGAATLSSSFSVAQNTTPTGVAINRLTGEYYVVDSNVLPGSTIKIRRYSNTGTYLGSTNDIEVDLSNNHLGTGLNAYTETNFKLHLDEMNNRFFLMAPNLNRVFAMTLPIKL